MIKNLSVIFIAASLLLVLTSPGCTTFSWDPTGTWVVTVTWDSAGWSWDENLTFSGSEDAGTVTGLTLMGNFSPQTGTFTKTGDYTLTVNFNFTHNGSNRIIDWTWNTTEDTPNTITGSGTWNQDGYVATQSMTATKTANLQ